MRHLRQDHDFPLQIQAGKGEVPWKVPYNYKPGKYLVKAHSNETNIYYPADGTGIITVIVEPPVPDDNITHNESKHIKVGLA